MIYMNLFCHCKKWEVSGPKDEVWWGQTETVIERGTEAINHEIYMILSEKQCHVI